MEENKTERLNFRVTEEEYKFLKNAAKEWGGSVSAYILAAVKRFNDPHYVDKMKFMREWEAEMKKFQPEVDEIGARINEVAHVVNVMKQQGEVIITEDMVEEVRALNEVLKKLVRYEGKAAKSLQK